ncbi:hypothetical protein AFL01nite_04030 [Aeromicrobium flavum]|uniref:Cell envelope biogenesis protein OmpA n=1 Tax=Aeromicrobium flavum TaxID=416568 RepID=A0A512HRL9_9ACTN|nr:DUF6069 family protein [Aeromicrobium flavum]GEO88076.1 hypothetical protein AFL01nite_04030 [Aeromicrobium flavum]
MSRLAVGARRASLVRVAVTGVVATVVAAALTTAAAAVAKSAGVDFEIPDGGESIPVAGFATVTTAFSLVGVGIALALSRWSARPATRFVQIAVPLTAVSLAPPFAVGADAGTAETLVGLHLVAAAVMVPAMARCLRRGSD